MTQKIEHAAIVAAMLKARDIGVQILASDCEAILLAAASTELMECGHHKSLMLISAETGQPLYCEYCDCISRRNDAEAMESELSVRKTALLARVKTLELQNAIAMEALGEYQDDVTYHDDILGLRTIKSGKAARKALSHIRELGEKNERT